MKIQTVLGLATALLATQAVFGDTTIGSLNDTTNSSSGHTYLGQTFTAPTGVAFINSVSMVLHGPQEGGSNGNWEIYNYDAGANTLGTLLDTAPVSVYSESPVLPYTQAFNTPVTPGNHYALLVNWGNTDTAGGYFSSNSYYSGGTTILSTDGSTPVVFNNYDMAFEVTFAQVPEPALLGVIAPLMLLVRRRRAS
jgi:hypothetical protein